MLPAIIGGHLEEETERRADQLCQRFGIAPSQEKYPAEISGGEKQRTAVARALINEPLMILADEPTGNLDSRSSREIVELLKVSNEKYGQTLLVITHDESIALQADRILSIEDGKITRDEVIRR